MEKSEPYQGDFNGWDEPAPLDAPALASNSRIEHLVFEATPVPSATSLWSKPTLSSLLTTASKYLKRNKGFLGIIFALWMFLGIHDAWVLKVPLVSQIYRLLNSRSLGGVLRFLTATYNGPMPFRFLSFSTQTLYGYAVALVAKSSYLLAMTGVIIPSIKEYLKNGKSSLGQYRTAYGKA